MKKTILIFATLILVFGLFSFPSAALADPPSSTTPPHAHPHGSDPGSAPIGGGGAPTGTPIGSGGDPNITIGSVTLTDPLGGKTIPQIIDSIVDFLVKAGAVLFTIMILIGAWQMITSAGQPEKTKQAKMTILWGAIGYAIILLAKGITSIIELILK